MSTITKERLQWLANISGRHDIDDIDGEEIRELARIALASLEAEPVAWAHRLINKRNGVVHPWVYGSAEASPSEGDIFNIEVMPLYDAPPAPVSVPAAMEMDDDFDSAFEHGKAVGWNAYRAAMLQGADGTLTNEGTIPVTQFKPVADLYGLTSPTGGETSFTFDAVEARDFIDGGWSCQEYVELGRFQEAMLQNGNSPAQSDCCPEQNYIAPAQDGNSPVIQDGWVACVERMPEEGSKVIVFRPRASESNDPPVKTATYKGGREYYHGFDCYCEPTHWMPLPAEPQQEVK